MKRLIVAAVAVLLVAGCGSKVTVARYVPPQSARTPEGAIDAAPPVLAPGVSLFALTSSSIHISQTGLTLIEGFEGWSSCPYWDSYGGVWTRGYGETEGITRYSPCISRATGQANLRILLETRYMWAVRGLGTSLTQNQIDSLASTVWNLGAGIIGPGTQLGSLLRQHAYHAYANALLAYDHAGGVVLQGLRTRREAEARLFLTPDPVAKPSRATLLRELAALRADRLRHHCAVPPKYGGGRYHRICKAWTLEGARVHRELRGL